MNEIPLKDFGAERRKPSCMRNSKNIAMRG